LRASVTIEQANDSCEAATRGEKRTTACRVARLALCAGRGDHVPASLAEFQDRDGPAALLQEAVLAWVILIIAGMFEVVWASAMKQSAGFTRPGASIVTIVAMLISFGLLSWAMRSLPLGTSYMVWTGIGAIGAFAFGALVLGEAVSPLRLLAAALILGGLVLMKLATPGGGAGA
jgi:quaternary ammonium compound-resistance protein SugE